MFLARVERLPVTSRSHVTDRLTDKCKIRLMIRFSGHIHLGAKCSVLDAMFYSTIHAAKCTCNLYKSTDSTHLSNWLGDYFVHTTQ